MTTKPHPTDAMEMPQTRLRFEVALNDIGERLDYTASQLRAERIKAYDLALEDAAKAAFNDGLAASKSEPQAQAGEPGKCAQCNKEYRHCTSGKGCPKCAPGVVIPESEFKKPLQAQAGEPDNWQQYANDGENAQQCIERHRKEHEALLELLKKARRPYSDNEEMKL